MKVYILHYDDNWADEHKIEGVYTTFEKALEAKDELMKFLSPVNPGAILGIKAYLVQE